MVQSYYREVNPKGKRSEGTEEPPPPERAEEDMEEQLLTQKAMQSLKKLPENKGPDTRERTEGEEEASPTTDDAKRL